MIRRIPVIATLIVAPSIAAMIALGLWQLLVRLPQKQAQLGQLAANPGRPWLTFPANPDESLLFRRSFAVCRPPITVTRAGAGTAGYRLIATCAARPQGQAPRIQLGTTRDPTARVAWSGGRVSGWISHAPDATPLIARLLRPRPRTLLLVADQPVAGLSANTRPDIGLVPNNHLAYAGQWFFFAAVAAVIYTLALRRRTR